MWQNQNECKASEARKQFKKQVEMLKAGRYG